MRRIDCDVPRLYQLFGYSQSQRKGHHKGTFRDFKFLLRQNPLYIIVCEKYSPWATENIYNAHIFVHNMLMYVDVRICNERYTSLVIIIVDMRRSRQSYYLYLVSFVYYITVSITSARSRILNIAVTMHIMSISQ